MLDTGPLGRLAQAELVGAVVATDNPGHLTRFVEAKSWKEIA
jgi:hypothetical protein